MKDNKILMISYLRNDHWQSLALKIWTTEIYYTDFYFHNNSLNIRKLYNTLQMTVSKDVHVLAASFS